jgi:Family of unknown function (DUF5675)
MRCLNLFRQDLRPDGIISKLCDEQNNFLFMTLEHSFDGEPKIPNGVYTCVRRLSPHFGYDMFMLKDVPGHSFIEIHIGNFNQDSNGCILLGEALAMIDQGQKVMVTRSEESFDKFMAMMEDQDSFQLTVSG